MSVEEDFVQANYSRILLSLISYAANFCGAGQKHFIPVDCSLAYARQQCLEVFVAISLHDSGYESWCTSFSYPNVAC